uniref:Uncharacterized protein n=1 Tax=Ditylenchus dipsaci TaxID=166011 RepID=A0A915DYR4_9BILA
MQWRDFRRKLRLYNSFCSRAPTSVNQKPAPPRGEPAVLLNQEMSHNLFDLEALPGQNHAFCQIYFLDTVQAMPAYRNNPLFAPNEDHDEASREVRDPNIHPRVINTPQGDAIGEVAAIFCSTSNEPPPRQGTWVSSRHRQGCKIPVPIFSRNLDPLCYPLIFPHGTHGWHLGIDLVEPMMVNQAQSLLPNQDFVENRTDTSSHSDVESTTDRLNLQSTSILPVEADQQDQTATVTEEVLGRRTESRHVSLAQFTRYRYQLRGSVSASHHLWDCGPRTSFAVLSSIWSGHWQRMFSRLSGEVLAPIKNLEKFLSLPAKLLDQGLGGSHCTATSSHKADNLESPSFS